MRRQIFRASFLLIVIAAALFAQSGGYNQRGNAYALQGVRISQTAPTNNQVLTYVSSTQLWTPSAAASSGVTGSGITGFLAGWTSSSAIGNSVADYGITTSNVFTIGGVNGLQLNGSGGSQYIIASAGKSLNIQAGSGQANNFGDQNQIVIVNGVAGAATSGPWSAATYSTATKCASGAAPAVCAAAAAGSVAVPTGATPSLTVNTTAVTASSQILLTVDESAVIPTTTCNTTLSTLPTPVVTARVAGTSFTIQVNATLVTNPACVSYVIIN